MTTLAFTAWPEVTVANNKSLQPVPIPNRASPKHWAGARRADVPHKGVYLGLVGFFAWMMLVYSLAFRHDTEASFGVVVSIFYIAMYFAVPGIIWSMAKHEAQEAPEGSFRDFLTSQFQTATGPMAGWEATIQIWCIPAALSLAATGLAIAMRLA